MALVYHYSDTGDQSAIIGWNSPIFSTCAAFAAEFDKATNDQERAAARSNHPECRQHQRFFFGYDGDNVARIRLHDARGNPRINLFVTPDGQAKMQFLDADGKVTYQLPQ